MYLPDVPKASQPCHCAQTVQISNWRPYLWWQRAERQIPGADKVIVIVALDCLNSFWNDNPKILPHKQSQCLRTRLSAYTWQTSGSWCNFQLWRLLRFTQKEKLKMAATSGTSRIKWMTGKSWHPIYHSITNWHGPSTDIEKSCLVTNFQKRGKAPSRVAPGNKL